MNGEAEGLLGSRQYYRISQRMYSHRSWKDAEEMKLRVRYPPHLTCAVPALGEAQCWQLRDLCAAP